MKTKILSLSALFLTLAATALRTVCLLMQYDPSLGYLQRGILPTIATTLTTAGTLFCFFCGLAFPRAHSNKDTLPTVAKQRAWAILYTLSAAACFFGGVYLLTDPSGDSLLFYKVTGILALLLATFFLIGCSGDQTKSASASAALLPWLPFSGILMLLLLAGFSYFDQTVTINGPLTVPMIFAALFGCLFLLTEVRIRAAERKTAVQMSLTLIAFFLCTTVGISNLVYCLIGDTARGISISQPARPILLLAISFAAAARLFCHTPTTTLEEI